MAHRYFTEDIGGDTARITGEDARHLAQVLRAKEGQHITVCDGRGGEYGAEIVQLGKGEVLLRLGERQKTQAEPALWAEVFIGLARGERMEHAIQKAVELGASAIWPFVGKNCVVKLKDPAEKTVRYTRIAHEAAKQCGRGILPQVGNALEFDKMLEQAARCEKALIFHEKQPQSISMRSALQGAEALKTLALITGPEGGFDADEVRRADEAGCVRVYLGPRILRCETAPAAALAAAMLLTGNLE